MEGQNNNSGLAGDLEIEMNDLDNVIATLAAVEIAFRTGDEGIENTAFLAPVVELQEIYKRLDKLVVSALDILIKIKGIYPNF